MTTTPTIQPTQTPSQPFPFSNAVLRDLLDDELSTLEVANRHDLDLFAVRDAVQSEPFRRAAEAQREADLARADLMWHSMQARAVHRLARIAHQQLGTTAQTESARRACTALLKVGRHSVPTLPGSTPPQAVSSPPGGTARRAVSSARLDDPIPPLHAPLRPTPIRSLPPRSPTPTPSPTSPATPTPHSKTPSK